MTKFEICSRYSPNSDNKKIAIEGDETKDTWLLLFQMDEASVITVGKRTGRERAKIGYLEHERWRLEAHEGIRKKKFAQNWLRQSRADESDGSGVKSELGTAGDRTNRAE